MSQVRDSRAANRVGLARLRPLAIKPIPQAKKDTSTGGLPDGWYFNETKEDQFWEDMEKTQDCKRNDMQDEMLKKTEHVTDLQDTSGKIRSLVEQFDDIDQDMLMTLVQLYDEGGGSGESMDSHMIMNDSKTHVLDFMTQLKTLSDQQTSLMETLRFWFSSLHQHSQNGENDITNEKMPSVNEVFEQMGDLVRNYTEKSEHAACLHNDINDFWFKQITQFKRTVMMRDEEIRKLQHSINESNAAAQARRAKKKMEEKKVDDSAAQKEALAAQIRINQEQKMQIEQLRKSLKENEIERVALGSMHGQSKERLQMELLEKDSDINTIRLEYESRLANDAMMIKEKEKLIKELKEEVSEKDHKMSKLRDQISDMARERDALDASLKKQLQMMELEREKAKEAGKDQKVEVDRREIYELQLAHEDEIRDLNAKHRQELVQQAEMAREKYARERDKLLKSLERSDTSDLLQSISDECEKKVEAMKQENEKAKADLIQQFAAKQALLTRQYENRIKQITAAHEVDLMMARDAAKYETKKREIEMEESYHLQLLEMNRERQEKYDDVQRQMEKLNIQLTRITGENERLKIELSEAKGGMATIAEEPDPDSVTDDDLVIKTSSEYQEEKLAEKFTIKLKVIKTELEDQMQWELEKQKVFYEREMNKQALQHQEHMRERLMELQEALVGVRVDRDEPQDIETIIAEISKTFQEMNEQINQIPKVEEAVATVTLEEAAARTKELTDRLIQLSSENQELKKTQIFAETSEEQVKKLKKRILYLESLQSKDQVDMYMKFKEMEEHYKHELDVKEQMLINLGKTKVSELPVRKVPNNYLENFTIYAREPNAEGSTEKPKPEVIIETRTVERPKPILSKTGVQIDVDVAPEVIIEEVDEEEYIPPVPIIVPIADAKEIQFPVGVPKPTDSAPVECSSIGNPVQSPKVKTSRKVVKRRVLPTISVSTQADKPSLEVVNECSLVDIAEIEPQQRMFGFEAPALIFENAMEFQEQVKADIIPLHLPEEKPLVEIVVAEVFERISAVATARNQKRLIVSDSEAITEIFGDERARTPIRIPEVIERRVEVEVPAPAVYAFEKSISDPVMFNIDLNVARVFFSDGECLEWIPDESGQVRRTLIMTKDEVHSRTPLSHGIGEVQTENMITTEDVMTWTSNRPTPVASPKVTRPHSPVIVPKPSTYLSHEVLFEVLLIEEKPQQPPVILKVDDEKAQEKIDELQRELENVRAALRYAEASKSQLVVVKDTNLGELAPIKKFKTAMPLTGEEARAINMSRQKLGVPIPKIDEPHESFTAPPPSPIKEEEPAIQEEEEEEKKEPEQPVSPPVEQLSLQKEMSMAEFQGDPFEAARNLIKSMIRYAKQFTSEDAELLREFGANTDAYDAYLSAIETTDEAHFSFMQRLKSNRREIDNHHGSLFQMNVANEQMYRFINMMSNQYMKATEKIKRMEEKEIRETIEMQQELLTNLTARDKDPSIPKTLDQLDTLHKLEASLDLVKSLGLVKGESALREQLSLLERVKSEESVLTTTNEEIDSENLEKLVRDVQEFIGTVKNLSVNDNHKDEFTGDESIEQLKADLSRVRKIRDNLAREKKYAKAREDALKEQIVQLNNRIANDKEMAENDIRGYQAQIVTLKRTFDAIIGGEKGSPEEVAERVKMQILNMQALLDAATAERDMYKDRSNDAEEALQQAEQTISNLNHQIEELMLNIPEVPANRTLEEDIFREAEMKQLKEMQTADRLISEQQRLQLEQSVAENKLLSERCRELEQKVIKMRQEVQQANDMIDDLRLKTATQSAVNQKPPCDDKATQCSIEPQVKTIIKEVRVPQPVVEVKKPVVEQEVLEWQKPIDEMRVIEEVSESEEEEKKQVEETPVQTETVSVETENKEEAMISLGTSQVVAESGFIDPKTIVFYDENDEFGALIQKSDDIVGKGYLDDDIMRQVHKPLDYMIKKPKVVIPVEQKVKPNKTFRVLPLTHHNNTKAASSIERQTLDLTVNGACQGRRSLTGATGPIKPTALTSRSKQSRDDDSEQSIPEPLPMVAATATMPPVCLQNVIHQIAPVSAASQSRSSFRESQLLLKQQQQILKEQISLEKLKAKNKDTSLVEPMRITLVVHKEEKKEKEDKGPIIITQPIVPLPQRRSELLPMAQSPSNVVKGASMTKPTQSPELKEATNIISKLREQLKKSQQANEKKDLEIISLKQKISELTLQIHRLRLDNIKHADDVKRNKIRYDNIKSRLDICFREIGVRDDQITTLKREIMVLKTRQQPVNTSLAKMKNAERENARLKREEERRKAIAAVAQNAMKNANNEETKKHLVGIVEHEQASIARIEAQRRMWSEIERNHMMGVLSAMSLLATSQYKTVREVLPEYSPFASTKVSALKQVLAKSREYRAIDSDVPVPRGHRGGPISYNDKIAVLDKVVDPPLSVEEKRAVVAHRESPDIEDRLVKLIKDERSESTMSKGRLDTVHVKT